jgi:hypothetical protein
VCVVTSERVGEGSNPNQVASERVGDGENEKGRNIVISRKNYNYAISETPSEILNVTAVTASDDDTMFLKNSVYARRCALLHVCRHYHRP